MHWQNSFYHTSQSSHESLNGTTHWSENKVAVDSSDECDGESKADHDQTGHGQVDQDEVERLPELLVLSGDHQSEEVDGEASADQEEHVESQNFELNWISQVVLWVFKRTSHKPRPVVHGDVEVLSLCAVLHLH